MKKIITTFKRMFLSAVVLVMAQSCIPNVPGGNPSPNYLSGKIKSIQQFSYLDGFPALVGLQVNFKYDSIGRPNEIEATQDGMVAGKYKIIYDLNKITIVAQPGYRYSQYGITKTTYFIQPNSNFIDSMYQTMNDSILYIRELIERNNLDEILRINYFSPTVTSNLSHIILNNFTYSDGNITSYTCTNSYNYVFNFNLSYDLSKNQKPFTNTYYGGFLRTPSMNTGFGILVDTDNVIDFLGLSYGRASINLISVITTEVLNASTSYFYNDTIQYQTYTDQLVKTSVKRGTNPFYPNLYINLYSQNTYY